MKKLLISAVLAAVALGGAATVATTAQAQPPGWHGHHFWHGRHWRHRGWWGGYHHHYRRYR